MPWESPEPKTKGTQWKVTHICDALSHFKGGHRTFKSREHNFTNNCCIAAFLVAYFLSFFGQTTQPHSDCRWYEAPPLIRLAADLEVPSLELGETAGWTEGWDAMTRWHRENREKTRHLQSMTDLQAILLVFSYYFHIIFIFILFSMNVKNPGELPLGFSHIMGDISHLSMNGRLLISPEGACQLRVNIARWWIQGGSTPRTTVDIDLWHDIAGVSWEKSLSAYTSCRFMYVYIYIYVYIYYIYIYYIYICIYIIHVLVQYKQNLELGGTKF